MDMQTIASILIGFTVSVVVLYHKFRSRTPHETTTENPEVHDPAPNCSRTQSELSLNSRDICSICLESHRFKIETSCHHYFCANCFTSFWHMGNFVLQVNCPMCRSAVTKLTILFNENENCEENLEKHRLINEVTCFNRLYSIESKSWMELILDLPVIIRHCARQFIDVSSLSILHRLRIAVLIAIFLVNCLVPLELIPESGFGILGFIDDILIIAIFLTYIAVFIRQTVNGRNVIGFDIDEDF